MRSIRPSTAGGGYPPDGRHSNPIQSRRPEISVLRRGLRKPLDGDEIEIATCMLGGEVGTGAASDGGVADLTVCKRIY